MRNFNLDIFFKLFNELFKLRSDLEEKTELITEKSNQITILQNNVNTLSGQLNALDYEKHVNMLTSWESTPKKELTLQKSHEKHDIGFIDKHIIRPLRGGIFDQIRNLLTKIKVAEICKISKKRII